MKKLLAAAMIVLMIAAFIPMAAAEGEVIVYNWEDYINDEVLAMFEEETGIKVKYSGFTTNEDMLVQVRTNPGEFDVVFPSDYAIERLIKEDLLAPIDYDKVPNAVNTEDWLKDPAYDPNGEHSVPYMWGTVGILYDTTKVTGPVDSWGVLFDPTYQKDVFMLDSIRDSMGIAL
ncbi:MAG: extracellular solute-binding protein [Clostridiales bacterium]|nr:extracellular solute-binding protein [Clostridiales bacterium]